MSATDVGSPAAESEIGKDTPTPLSAWLGLGAMLLVLVYSTVDRQIFILLAEPLKRDLRLSDGQLGLLQGIGLALVSLATTFPIAWLADRYDRRWVTAACVLVWSLAVVGCGLAPGFTWLLGSASLVGVGEAGAGPASFAMIPDLFPVSRRQLANSVFAIGSRLGQALGAVLAGWLVMEASGLRRILPPGLASLPDWRLAFLAAALFAPIGVVLVLTLPRRAAGLGPRPEAMLTRAPDAPLFSFLRRNAKAQFGFILGYALATFGFTSVATWVPVIAMRDYHQTAGAAGAWLGAMGLVTGLAGFVLGTIVLRLLQPRLGPRLPILAMVAVALLGAACAGLIGTAMSIPQLYIYWGVEATFLMTIAMVVPTAMQNMTPRHLRARLFAVAAVCLTVAGALSPLVVGLVSDRLKGMTHPLLTAAMLTSAVSLVLAAAVLLRTVPAYVRLAAAVEAEG